MAYDWVLYVYVADILLPRNQTYLNVIRAYINNTSNCYIYFEKMDFGTMAR